MKPDPMRDALLTQSIEARYWELIYAVARKWPGESRHQTALRYIMQAENAAVMVDARSNEQETYAAPQEIQEK